MEWVSQWTLRQVSTSNMWSRNWGMGWYASGMTCRLGYQPTSWAPTLPCTSLMSFCRSLGLCTGLFCGELTVTLILEYMTVAQKVAAWPSMSSDNFLTISSLHFYHQHVHKESYKHYFLAFPCHAIFHSAHNYSRSMEQIYISSDSQKCTEICQPIPLFVKSQNRWTVHEDLMFFWPCIMNWLYINLLEPEFYI